MTATPGFAIVRQTGTGRSPMRFERAESIAEVVASDIHVVADRPPSEIAGAIRASAASLLPGFTPDMVEVEVVDGCVSYVLRLPQD